MKVCYCIILVPMVLEVVEESAVVLVALVIVVLLVIVVTIEVVEESTVVLVVSHPDPSHLRSAGCIASPARGRKGLETLARFSCALQEFA